MTDIVFPANVGEVTTEKGQRAAIKELARRTNVLKDAINSGVGGGGGGGGAPTDASYLTGAASAGLSAERIVTDTPSVGWDLATGGQAKALVKVTATDKLLGRVTAGAGTVEEIACTAAGRAIIDDADAAAQRATLGLGTASTHPATDFSVPGHTHAEGDVVGLVADLAAKAPLASPAFTGAPLVPTAAAGTNTTQAASTAFVNTAIGTGRVLPAFPAITGLELRLSAELSVITHADGLVTGVTDISGNARNATNGSVAGKPRYFKRRFNHRYPALWLDGTNNDHLNATLPNLAQPFTIVIVCEELAIGTGDGNLYRDQTARAVGYQNAGNSWSIHGGTNNFSSAALYSQARVALPTNGPSVLPLVRIDLYNGAASLIANNSVEVVGDASGSGTQLGGVLHIGNGATAITSAAKMLLYEFLVFSKALSAPERAQIVAYYRDAVDLTP